MNKQLEDKIKPAHKLLENELKASGKTHFDKEVKGYISSFGPSVRIAGLLATLAFYLSKNTGVLKERAKIVDWLCTIIGYAPGSKALFEEVSKSQNNTTFISQKQSEILTAITALKLAFRTFPVVGDPVPEKII